jgi:hypothetical protein
MLRIKWLAIAAACGSLSAGVALAASQSSETTPVTADFEASLVAQAQRACDANHLQFRLRFEGSQTSSDPRLTGDLEARVRSVVNTQNGYGYTAGDVVIRDQATSRAKFRGAAVGVLQPDGGTEGFLTGRTIGPASVRLLANFNVQQDLTTGAITGELGTDSQTGELQDPAVLTNACRGDDDEDD